MKSRYLFLFGVVLFGCSHSPKNIDSFVQTDVQTDVQTGSGKASLYYEDERIQEVNFERVGYGNKFEFSVLKLDSLSGNQYVEILATPNNVFSGKLIRVVLDCNTGNNVDLDEYSESFKKLLK